MNNAFIYTDAKLTFLIGQCKTWPLFLPVSLNELNFIASCRTVVFPFCHMHIAVGASSPPFRSRHIQNAYSNGNTNTMTMPMASCSGRPTFT